jgi:xanthine dehydrogenase accessory factor
VKLALVEAALAAAKQGRSAALATDLASGRQALVMGGSVTGELALEPAALEAVRGAIADDRPTTIEAAGGRVFVEIFSPPLNCAIIGAVHIAQPLAQMAALAGYAVTIIDPRSAFATDARFPGVALSTDWPDEFFARHKPDRRTAVVTLTHDPKIDDPALTAALSSEAFYIGALGSRKTHAGRLARLMKAGFDEAALARIHGPVGLAIGAISPAEIAVSILAQITSVLRADNMARKAAPAS